MVTERGSHPNNGAVLANGDARCIPFILPLTSLHWCFKKRPYCLTPFNFFMEPGTEVDKVKRKCITKFILRRAASSKGSNRFKQTASGDWVTQRDERSASAVTHFCFQCSNSFRVVIALGTIDPFKLMHSLCTVAVLSPIAMGIATVSESESYALRTYQDTCCYKLGD